VTGSLRLADFELDPATGVRVPAGAAGVPAGYLDGAEQRLLEALPAIADRSSGSDALRGLMVDWPTTYHLTPYRSTLFDALGLRGAASARVLELGAGCGAITRWLGERCAEVHAVEGDRARAQVARTRCADLDPVEVYAANYSELAEARAFDLVTLIGVLEYSHLYHPRHPGDADAAAAANLALARRALADDGVLVLAIENRLGLKYLNGAREDHSGRRFEGMEGYVHAGTPVTWSARALRGMLAAAGFADVELLLPFPDYKLAHTIVNPARCGDSERVHNWLAEPAPDRGAEREPLLFAETLAVREVAQAGLLADLANSLLVLAYAGDRERADARLGIDLDWSARRYSLDRRAGLRKRATLRGDVVVHEHPELGDADEAHARERVAAFGVLHDPRPEPFRAGDLVLFDVLRTLVADGLGERFAAHVERWRAWLLEAFGTGEGAGELALVDGAAFDATWWNLVVDPADGTWQRIDREWRLARAVPIGFVLWRMLKHFVLRHRAELPADLRDRPPEELLARMLVAGGVRLPDGVADAFAALEAELVDAIGFAPLPDGPSAALETVGALAVRPRGFSVLALADEVAQEPELLRAFAERFGPDDAATLMIYAPDAEAGAAAAAIEAALRAAGIGDDGPDLMLLALPSGPETHAAVLREAAVLLSSRPAEAPFAALPRFPAGEVDRLRAAAESFWAIGALA
jgi:SAM-dependent methyltransferase